MDISWFMRFVNEGIARQANAKDNCTGRFWEGRFSSQALLDEAAFAACMVYVDLNPVRSRMSGTPETSDHTSIKKRIQHVLNIEPSDYQKLQPEGLYPFVGNPRTDMPDGLPFELSEYIELVDLTGKQLREGGTRSFTSCNHDISASMHVKGSLTQQNYPYCNASALKTITGKSAHAPLLLQPRY